jgi:hypothetical protein
VVASAWMMANSASGITSGERSHVTEANQVVDPLSRDARKHTLERQRATVEIG